MVRLTYIFFLPYKIKHGSHGTERETEDKKQLLQLFHWLVAGSSSSKVSSEWEPEVIDACAKLK